jgi:hypothetical protein
MSSKDQGKSDGRSGSGYRPPSGTRDDWENSSSEVREYDLGYNSGLSERNESGERNSEDDDGRGTR